MGKSRFGTAIILMISLLSAGCGQAMPIGQAGVAGLPETAGQEQKSENPTGPGTQPFAFEIALPEHQESDFRIECDGGGETAYEEEHNRYLITAAGEYDCYGNLFEGQLVVSADSEAEVTIRLNGCLLTNSKEAPVTFLTARKVELSAGKGTENKIYDLRTAAEDSGEDASGGAVYAECDLTVKGNGSLEVVSDYNNGIHTKDDLKIKNLSLTVKAVNHALKGNDSVIVESGTITAISVGGDAVKTTSADTDKKGGQRGRVEISGGTLQLFAAHDGIDSASDIILSEDAVLEIATDKYSPYSASNVAEGESVLYLRVNQSLYEAGYQYAAYFYRAEGSAGGNTGEEAEKGADGSKDANGRKDADGSKGADGRKGADGSKDANGRKDADTGVNTEENGCWVKAVFDHESVPDGSDMGPGGFSGTMQEPGEFPEGFPGTMQKPGEFPEGFPGEMQEPGEFPEGFPGTMQKPGEFPEGFPGTMQEPGEFPEGFPGTMQEPGEFPEGFPGEMQEPGEFPEGFPGEMQEPGESFDEKNPEGTDFGQGDLEGFGGKDFRKKKWEGKDFGRGGRKEDSFEPAYYYRIKRPAGYTNVRFYVYAEGQTPGQDGDFLAVSEEDTVLPENWDTFKAASVTDKLLVSDGWTSSERDLGKTKLAYSCKGMKAGNRIEITGGTITIRAGEDGIHADFDEILESTGQKGLGNILISGGNITVASGDDGIHADQDLTVNGGTVEVTQSYEGLEANRIYVSDGTVTIYADDDAINANAKGAYAALIEISGGMVDAAVPNGDTDTMDSNGTILISGGMVFLKNGQMSGSSMIGGTIDAERSVAVTGGNVAAIGCIGSRIENSAADASQTFESGDYTIQDKSGNVIMRFTLTESYRGYMFCSDRFVKGETYTVYQGTKELFRFVG